MVPSRGIGHAFIAGNSMNQLMRYKKSLILLSAGLTVGIIVTLLAQALTNSPDKSSATEQASAESGRSSNGARLASTPAAPPPPAPVSAPLMPPVAPVAQYTQPQYSQAVPNPGGYGQPLPPQYQYQQQQSYSVAPVGTMQYGQSSSGYPTAIGRRAVDSYVPSGGVLPGGVSDGNTVIIDPGPSSNVVIDPTPGLDVQNMTVGRNGLLGNPCSDPPSCRGRAYSNGPQ